MKRIGFLIVLFALAAPALALDKKELPDYLQKTNVAIKVNNQQIGSGSVVTRKVGDHNVTFILTAAHVVDSLRKTRSVIDPGSGTPRTVVEFDDAQLVQELREDGRRVGETNVDARVIRYSNAETGEDLAVLMVRKLDYTDKSIKFHLEKEPPVLGTELYHCGSPLGQIGTNSITSGIMSQVGRIYLNKLYDQTSTPVFGGSSGGCVVVSDSTSDHFGEYIGMVVRGADGGFTLVVPVRRMIEWAKKVKIDFLFDDKVNIPTLDDITKESVEDIGVTFKGNAPATAKPVNDGHPSDLPDHDPFKFMINKPRQISKPFISFGPYIFVTSDIMTYEPNTNR